MARVFNNSIGGITIAFDGRESMTQVSTTHDEALALHFALGELLGAPKSAAPVVRTNDADMAASSLDELRMGWLTGKIQSVEICGIGGVSGVDGKSPAWGVAVIPVWSEKCVYRAAGALSRYFVGDNVRAPKFECIEDLRKAFRIGRMDVEVLLNLGDGPEWRKVAVNSPVWRTDRLYRPAGSSHPGLQGDGFGT